MSVRILAFSDLHRDVSAARAIVEASVNADIVIGAGDFATRGEGAAETLDILRQCERPVVLVHGNHDRPEQLSRLCEDWRGSSYIHGTNIDVAGISVFGVGGEVPARNDFDWNASESEEDAAQMLATASGATVLVTHTPPFGIADLQKDGTHEGSTAIASFIREEEPALCLCGHIHNAWGMEGQVGRTYIRNLGPKANWFEI